MSGLNDPALHLFGVPLAIGLTLVACQVFARVRARRRRNGEIALRRSEWRRLNHWKPDE